MKKYLCLVFFVMLGLGCARVRVEGSTEPIRVDVSMRLDIYQHIEKDIDQIENMVSGSSDGVSAVDQKSLWDFLMTDAYADDGLGPDVEAAVSSRRQRRSELIALEGQGVIGENKLGLVEIRSQYQAGPDIEKLVWAENQDRMTIYRSIAHKNGSSIEDVQRLYAKRLQADAPVGTPIEAFGETGGSVWRKK